MTAPALQDDARVLPAPLRWLVPRGSITQAVARGAMLGLVDHVALRTLEIDAALAGWIDARHRRAAPQVVILGAGLDTRAYRLPVLEHARVFEVDHPASQAAKLAAVRDHRPRCLELVHVAVDFAKQDLDVVLAERGHDAAAPTAWVLEGVAMYLPEAVTSGLLAVVAARSAPESLLAMTYMRPPEHPLPPIVRRAIELPLLAFGEPLRGAWSPEAIAARIRDVGLEVRSDTCSVEWSARFGASAFLARAFRSERLVIAER
jgi:methyltransferase (TIGR00027 family)